MFYINIHVIIHIYILLLIFVNVKRILLAKIEFNHFLSNAIQFLCHIYIYIISVINLLSYLCHVVLHELKSPGIFNENKRFLGKVIFIPQ